MGLSLLLFACFDSGNGTAVGNPATAGFTGIDIPHDVYLEASHADIKVLKMEDCKTGQPAMKWVGQSVDLLEDAVEVVSVDAGRWCDLRFALGGQGLYLVGETAEGTPFDIVMHPGEDIPIGRKFTADGQSMVVAVVFEDFVDAETLDAIGGFVRSSPGDPLSDAWAAALPDSVLVVHDISKDGFPDADDPTLFDPWVDAPDDGLESQVGCSAVGSMWAWGVLGLAGLLLARRR